MRIWHTSSSRFAPPIPVCEPLRLRRLSGRWRGRRHVLLGVLAAWGGWAWMGFDSAVLVTVWWWSWRPRPALPGLFWLIEPRQVRSLRPGYWRTRLTLVRGRSLEIFHDELSAADLARLRRELKRQLAAG
jgi:hypothetical protein